MLRARLNAMTRQPGGNEDWMITARRAVGRVALEAMFMVRLVVAKFAGDQRGIETVEWAVIAAILVAGLVAAIGGLGSNVLNKFTVLQSATQ
jgi:Flp pilus assembly pilin Flp